MEYLGRGASVDFNLYKYYISLLECWNVCPGSAIEYFVRHHSYLRCMSESSHGQCGISIERINICCDSVIETSRLYCVGR